MFATPISPLHSKANNRHWGSQPGWQCGPVFLPDEFIGDGMGWIAVMGAALVLLAAVVEADAQGGYGPGVNPSNPSDLTYRSI